MLYTYKQTILASNTYRHNNVGSHAFNNPSYMQETTN